MKRLSRFCLGVKYWSRANKRHELARQSVGLVRYADDFVVFCHTKEKAEQAKEKLKKWFAERGLTFSEEKTRIVNLDVGLDFLGFNIKQYRCTYSKSGYKLLTKPSKDSVLRIRRRLKATFRKWRGHTVDLLIKDLNPVIRGWTNYFRIGVSSRTFENLDNYLFQLQKRWVGWQHPNKPWKWQSKRYWGHYRQGYNWVFGNKNLYMLKFGWTPIRRHIMVQRNASWDDPELESYWDERKIREIELWLTDFKKKVAKQQGYVCPVCKDHLANGEEIHGHHLVPKVQGGSNHPSNYVLVHYYCHQAVHVEMRRRKVVAESIA